MNLIIRHAASFRRTRILFILFISFFVVVACSPRENLQIVPAYSKNYSNNTLAPEFGVFHPGRREKYIDPVVCYEYNGIDYRRLHLPLNEVSWCAVEELPFDKGTIKLVKLQTGPGRDCESGCIYDQQTILINKEEKANIDKLGVVNEIRKYLLHNDPPCDLGLDDYEFIDMGNIYSSLGKSKRIVRAITKRGSSYKMKLIYKNLTVVPPDGACSLQGELVIDMPVDLSSLKITATRSN